jgi:hypothetical protein
MINKVSKLVADQFPDFYKEEGPKFLAFMEAYYSYLEENGKLNNRIQNLESYRDINTTTDEFIDYFTNTFLPSVPVDIAADKKIAAKYVNEFNQSRGTLAAYRLLFRAVYNEDVDFIFPADNMLKVSDGEWRIVRYLSAPYDPKNFDFVGKTILGLETRSKALVETILRKTVRGRDLHQIILSNIRGNFQHEERIVLESELNKDGHSTVIEGGIHILDIISQGSEYRPGDKVKLESKLRGDFGKAVVVDTVDLGGILTFNIVDGGSGYQPTIDEGGTTVELIGGDGDEPASFKLFRNSIEDTFRILVKTPFIESNTVFGDKAPTIGSVQISTFKDMPLSSPNFGFAENGEEVTSKHFRTNANAIINIANTFSIDIGTSLYGVTSGANAVVTRVVDTTDGDAWFEVDTYKNFDSAENIKTVSTTGSTVGTVTEFQSNTIGTHLVGLGLVSGESISEGDEIIGLNSGSHGIVKKIKQVLSNQYTHSESETRDLYRVIVSANNSANLTNSFDTGPLKGFLDEEAVVKFSDQATVIANVEATTTNTTIESIYTNIEDALLDLTPAVGTIAVLADRIGGTGHTIAPTVSVRDDNIASLGIGEAYITVQTTDPNWGTSNSQIISFDQNDLIRQPSTGAIGYIKGGATSPTVTRELYSNGVYESVLRVWQPYLQRAPGGINWANNATITTEHYESDYAVFGQTDGRTAVGNGSAKIVKVVDEGVLGDNAIINASVGANGAITSIRMLDAGFAYSNGEVVTVEDSGRTNSTKAEVRLTIDRVANSEGFYATTRGHISSLRGKIHDGRFYQEYAYQVLSPLSLNRYKNIVLDLVHPAGQALFGRFTTQSNVSIIVDTTTKTFKKIKSSGTVSITKNVATGTVAITNNTFDITGTTTDFANEFSNADFAVVEFDPGDGIDNAFYPIQFANVVGSTTANMTSLWAHGNVSSANLFFATHDIDGTSTTFSTDFESGNNMFIRLSDNTFRKLELNTITSDTLANTKSMWSESDVSGATVYYTEEF